MASGLGVGVAWGVGYQKKPPRFREAGRAGDLEAGWDLEVGPLSLLTPNRATKAIPTRTTPPQPKRTAPPPQTPAVPRESGRPAYTPGAGRGTVPHPLHQSAPADI